MKLNFAANKFKPIFARLLYYPSQTRHNTLNPRSNLFWVKSPAGVAETPKKSLFLAWLFVALGSRKEPRRMSPDGVFHSQLCFACIDMNFSHTQLRKAVWADIHTARRLGSDLGNV